MKLLINKQQKSYENALYEDKYAKDKKNIVNLETIATM